MTTETPVKLDTIMGDYILPIIAYLKKDGTIIDIFVLSCLISIFVVLGSQLFLKGLLETFDIKLSLIAVAVIAGDGSDADVKNIPTGPNEEVRCMLQLIFLAIFRFSLGTPCLFCNFC